ncbi:MAG: putative membrane protein YkoI [Patiriisocius sp.]|jgi:uncharacterized membrane protein YkoI
MYQLVWEEFMKIALVLLIVGLFMFPAPEAAANYRLNTSGERVIDAPNKNVKQDYKVKNSKQATQMIKKTYRAKVLSVSSNKVNGNPGYKAKLLGNDGIVFYVYIDAISGQMIRR